MSKTVDLYVDKKCSKVFLDFKDGAEIPLDFKLYASCPDVVIAASIGNALILLEKDMTYLSTGAHEVARKAYLNFDEVRNHTMAYLLARELAMAFAKSVQSVKN